MRIFKQGDLNSELEKGTKLRQEVITRFGTTHDVVSRFLDSLPTVEDICNSSSNSELSNAFFELHYELGNNGAKLFPNLIAIST